MDLAVIDDQFILENIPAKRIIRNYNYFWIGFTIYTISSALTATENINWVICQVFQLAGLVLILPAFTSLVRNKIENKLLEIIFWLYIGWQLFTVVRGGSGDYGYIKNLLFDSWYGVFPFAVPLILLIPVSLAFYKRTFNFIVIFGLFYLILCAIFIADLTNPDITSTRSQGIVETFFLTMSMPIGYLLLTYAYHSKKVKIFSIIVIVAALLFAIIRARRGLIFICASQILFSYILFFFNSRKKVLIFFSSFVIIFFGFMYLQETMNTNNDTIFTFLMERGDEDTRTGVEVCLYNDMRFSEWIIGKGIDGEYLCPGIDEDNVTGYRTVIETGYLQIILKGGLISLGLFLLIAVPAVIKGLFYSKNKLSMASAIWVLLCIMYMYPATPTAFTLFYLLVWISIGICYSKDIRQMDDDKIMTYFTTIRTGVLK